MPKDDDGLRVVDTEDVLTVDELKELKKLASLSKTTRMIVAVLFGIVTLVGIHPFLMWLSAQFKELSQ